jgi:HAD superfamily hydrolase (TIGR01450 family)
VTTLLTTQQSFERYEAIRPRLPGAKREVDARANALDTGCVPAANLAALMDRFDVFVFDAFGVLNVGETPITGAFESIQTLRKAGKRLFVLTNAASYTFPQTIAKFQKLGFDFADEELISSRSVCETYLSQWTDIAHWGIIGPQDYYPAQLPVSNRALFEDPSDYDQVDGFLFLSSAGWSRMRQTMLLHSLAANPRPVVIANPDLVAPREEGLSLEPGYFAHELQDKLPGLALHFHGKPFPSVYKHIRTLLGPDIPNDAIAMVGDTLHTDILGARAQGWQGILVTDHGLFKGHNVMDYIQQSQIFPDYIIPSI